MILARIDNTRENNQIREIEVIKDYTKYAEGSVLFTLGDTKVICNATVEERIPPFKRGSGEGWITAEYSMLPRATDTRNVRDIVKLKLNGRAQEIQRLISRSMRSVVDLKALGERTIVIDCDVIQADGGTRTASINGAFIAMAIAMKKLQQKGIIQKIPLNGFVGAISVGIVNSEAVVDLCYAEDSTATVDMNVVMTDKFEFVELQGTGEERPFSDTELIDMLSLAKDSIESIIDKQKQILSDIDMR